MISDVKENMLISALASGFKRSLAQVNALHESDAELIRLPGGESLLAVTVDAIEEEIKLGLYDDPFMIGWMTVTVALSDLAAVGADPIGVLITETLPPNLEGSFLENLQRGIGQASQEYAAPVLGGDTNSASELGVAGVAVGLVPTHCAMTRIGADPGQILCATGPLGHGSAFAALKWLGRPVPFSFRPRARLTAGRLLRRHATCCMDTSDGPLATMDQLMRLNNVGFHLDDSDSWMHPEARDVARQLDIPPWMMLAGLHGEFELLFCISKDGLPALREEAEKDGWRPLEVGTVSKKPGIELSIEGNTMLVDTGAIRDLFSDALPPLDKLIGQIHACIQPRK